MLLVLSHPKDPVAERVTTELHRRGAPLRIVNPTALSGREGLRLVMRPGASELRWPDGDVVDLASVGGVWLWRPIVQPEEQAAATAAFGDATTAAYARAEWMALMGDLLQAERRRWFPALPSVVQRAEAKLNQLGVARALGFAIPETLITNDPDEAVAFTARFEGRVIFKPPSIEFGAWFLPTARAVYTTAVKPRHLAAIDSIAAIPVMLQRRVEKRLELRVTVVGDRVFAAAIHSQATRHTREDWRRYDHEHTPLAAYELPDATARRCVALAERLGLRYGAIDLILTPEGDTVFLEINPNGQWSWIEGHTGLPITAAICDELARDAEARP